jgi:sn-glycerol 3-phosphate transport system ATP-binding protein
LTIAAPGAGGFAMKLDYVEELGAQRLLHGMIDGQALVVATALEDDFNGEINLAIHPTDIHYFAAATGKRIDVAASQ